jgi:hypothetical protein
MQTNWFPHTQTEKVTEGQKIRRKIGEEGVWLRGNGRKRKNRCRED